MGRDLGVVPLALFCCGRAALRLYFPGSAAVRQNCAGCAGSISVDREQEGLTVCLWLCAALCGKGKAGRQHSFSVLVGL